MQKKSKKNKSLFGFTMIELLLVIAVISILASIILINMWGALSRARDAKRKTELDQIRKAIALYYSDNGHFPKEADGANGKVGEGAGLDTMLQPYMNVPHDPLGPGDPNYYYYYDGNQLCTRGGGTETIAVLFARKMERESGNPDDICDSWEGEGGAGSPEAYHIEVGPSSD